jgi:hypothetical protein
MEDMCTPCTAAMEDMCTPCTAGMEDMCTPCTAAMEDMCPLARASSLAKPLCFETIATTAAAPIHSSFWQVVAGDLERLRRTNPSSAEYSSLRSYIEMAVDLPWAKATVDKHDIAAAEVQLNADHFGLDKVRGQGSGCTALYTRVSKQAPSARAQAGHVRSQVHVMFCFS